MNNYTSLRKANRIRLALVSAPSQQQIRDIFRYLLISSWDLAGAEAVKSDLIDLAIQANQSGSELFDTAADAADFAAEMKKQCACPNPQNFFFLLIWWFLYNGLGYILLYFYIPNAEISLDTNYLFGLACSYIFCYFLWKYTMRRIDFPLRKHRKAMVAWLILYTFSMYMFVFLLNKLVPPVVFVRLNLFWWGTLYLLFYAIALVTRSRYYGNNPSVASRL